MVLSALAHLNWAAVVVAVASYFVLGGIWFPLIVKRAYAEALGTEMKSGILAILGPLPCLTVTTITCGLLIRLLGITTYAGALEFGLLIGIGFLTPMTVNIALNPLFPRPLLYSAINAPFFIGGSVLVSLIFAAIG